MSLTPKNILLCTLGASWAVIPEIMGWLAPQVLDLYAHHPQRTALDALRAQHQLQAPDELWICTTQGAQTQASLAGLHAWWQLLGAPLPLRIWAAAGTDQLASQAECSHIRELILRTTLLASEQVAGGQLVLSLAGGRKTMSADLQTAGSQFGAKAWLHVVSPEPSPPGLFARTADEKAEQPRLMAQALSADLAACITPLIAGTGTRNELLDIVIDGQRIDSTRFALPLANPGQAQAWQLPAQGDTLYRELLQRQTQSSQLMGNFLAQLAQTEHHDNWRSLYRLPPAQIERLRHTPLTPAHADWLTALPKADLHRHLGGCLGLDDQRQVAEHIRRNIAQENRLQRLADVSWLLSEDEWPWDWPARLAALPPQPGDPAGALLRAERCATLLRNASDAQLQHNLYGVTEPRIALKTSVHGFAAFERPGELSGSALLGHPAALAPYAQAIVAQAHAEGLAYLELRGSPQKYRPQDPASFVRDLQTALRNAGAQVQAGKHPNPGAPRIGFVWILDRRTPELLQKAVLSAVDLKALAPDFMLGLDVAGDEAQAITSGLLAAFAPAFEACLPITIHAGEGEAASNIWQAAYHLHADRIGHGLTLADHPLLAARFRDRGICLELCPSSNREVVGFADPADPQTAKLPGYPLRTFMHMGLPLTLCTDNPAISRTTLAAEYLAAARMTEDGLSQWEALTLMRQAYVHAFLPSAERETLLKRVDAQVFALVSEFDQNAIF
ncbi:MAG: hypothetical protein AUK51_07995 [Comamonadaceae bacterium CG2_30_59_20]|nr:MAG: hypothetical protein AUK51_07995 [Comamonadaceae bacterium CG2_30_59_20]